MSRTVAAILAAVLITASVAGVVAVGPAVAQDGDGDTITLPRQITLNTDSAKHTYTTTGEVHTTVLDPRMNVSIAEDRGDVGLGMTANPLETGLRNDFVKVHHREELDRTVRIPISEDYFHPFPREELQSVSGDKTAKLETATLGGERYTVLTVSFTGNESAVFPIPADAAASYSAVERVENRTNATFGVNLGLTPTPWTYIPSDAFAGNNTTSVRVEGNPDKMMLQYNDGTRANPQWLTVPDGDTSTSPVYYMEKEGVDDAVYVVSKTADAPRIRVKENRNWGDQISAWTRGARNIPDRVGDLVNIDVPEVMPF